MSPCPERGRSGAPGQLPQPADMRHARPPSLILSSANTGGCQSPGPPERSSAGPSPCRDLLRLWDDLRIRLQSIFKNPNNYRMEIGNCQRIRVVTRSQADEPQAGTDRITGMRIGSRLDVRFRADYVCFTPKSGHSEAHAGLPLLLRVVGHLAREWEQSRREFFAVLSGDPVNRHVGDIPLTSESSHKRNQLKRLLAKR